MVCFNEALARHAKAIIDARSTDDEMKAARDIAQAESMLSAIHQCLNACGQVSRELYDSATKLDNRLRQEHTEIDELQVCANRLASLVPSQNQAANLSDDIAHRLRMDVRGIMTVTLLKHKVIGRVDETLQQVTGPDDGHPYNGK